MSRPVLLRPLSPEETAGRSEPETDLRLELEALRVTAEHYRDFVENGVALAWSHDLDGTILGVNRAVLQGFATPEASRVVGRKILDFLEPRFLPRYNEYLHELQERGEARGFATFRGFDGELRVIAYSNVLRRDASGAPVVRGFGEIVTDFIRSKQDLERANLKLAEANHALEATNRALARTNRELELLNEMGDLLQSARDQRDAEEVLGNCLPRIFSRFAGAVYLDNGRPPLLEPAARWGDPPPAERTLNAADCWALRRGRIHFVDAEGGGPVCPHAGAERGPASCPRAAVDPWVESLCAPLMAEGQALGLLHLRELSTTGGGGERDGLASRRHLVANTAEQLALSLVNLRLREKLEARSPGAEE